MEGLEVVGLDLGQDAVSSSRRRGQVLAFFAGLSTCLVGIEACASAHYWGRELTSLGHELQLMPPAYVKRGKTDAPDELFVAVKTKVQQAVVMLHKTRDLLVRQRTMLINAPRGHLGGR